MLREKWKLIRDAIEADITAGALRPGDQLPTEPELCARFQSGRHSVRRAITELAADGRLSVEQGRGTFVETKPLLTYTIGRRTRRRTNLESQGVDVSGERLSVEIVPASQEVADALKLPLGAKVVKGRSITYADGKPIAFGSKYHDAARFPDFQDRREILGSSTATYESYGIKDYIRHETCIHSRRALRTEADMLRQHPDQPVMVVHAVDTTLDGKPLNYGEVVWSATRVRFVVSGPGENDD